jgi:hypothetical protein
MDRVDHSLDGKQHLVEELVCKLFHQCHQQRRMMGKEQKTCKKMYQIIIVEYLHDAKWVE